MKREKIGIKRIRMRQIVRSVGRNIIKVLKSQVSKISKAGRKIVMEGLKKRGCRVRSPGCRVAGVG